MIQISWGTKITALYTGFVIMIVSLVIAATRSKTSLVADDYYHQETVFQKRLDATAASLALPEHIRLQQNDETITIHFPAAVKTDMLNGSVHFYAPANEQADRSFSFNAVQDSFVISRSKLAKALYEVQISWNMNGKEYYQAMPLNLQ